MSALKKLAGQTAIYGLPSILGRFLYYLLVPLHTYIFKPEDYGVVTELFAYVAFLVVVLTYGMETAFFRFSNREDTDKSTIFSTSFTALAVTSGLFFALCWIFAPNIANVLAYPNHQEYIIWLAAILSIDAVTSVLMANLRQESRALWFAVVNIAAIAVNILGNLFFLWFCPTYIDQYTWIAPLYNPEIGVGYIFLCTLASSALKLILLLPYCRKLFVGFDFGILKQMLKYAWPLMLVGFAGIINETLDRALLKYLLTPIYGAEEAMFQLGVYGANYKLSIIITLFIQAFRYAAEPFFFKLKSDAKTAYVLVMDYFVWIISGIFLLVMLNIDFFKLFIRDEAYYEGLTVVPILLLSNMFLGINYNLSIWYKLTDKTKWGAAVSIAAAVVTVIFNFLLIPKMGYLGAAWATLICYAFLMLASGILGRIYFPVPYHYVKNTITIAAVIVIYLASLQLAGLYHYLFRGLTLIVFVGLFYIIELKHQFAKR